MSAPKRVRGTIAWMVYHKVAPNLLMLLFIFGGLFMLTEIKQEVFPEFELDTITIKVNLPGASPREVEEGIILVVEEAVRGIEGVKEINATAAEGSGSVVLDLNENQNRYKIYQDVQQAINRITTFPNFTEKPEVTLYRHQREVIDLQLYGQVDEWQLWRAAEDVREQILQSPDISQVELEGAKEPEIHIDISQTNLRRYGLTLNEVADIVRSASLSQGSGSVKTQNGEILLRMEERRDWASEFANIPLIVDKSGAIIRLDDVAIINEGFDDSINLATFNGLPAIGIEVYRVGDQTPVSVSDALKNILPEIKSNLPASLNLTVEQDRSDIYLQRIQLLLKNGFIGLLLVLLILSLFLEFKLAFWVTVGIPTAFLGTLLFLPFFNVSLNMVSLFAFIIALGIVVDDAIVVGENVYEYRNRGMSFVQAAIKGTKDISIPISFSIITNIVAFLPLMFIPGWLGKIWAVIPIVVSTAFVLSWFEAIFVLPAHLAYMKGRTENPKTKVGQILINIQVFFSNKLNYFITYKYGPLLRLSIQYRYLTVSIFIALLVIVIAIPMSGRMGFVLMPKVESDFAQATATLPIGSPVSKAIKVRDELYTSVQEVIKKNGGSELSDGIFALIKENSIEVRAYLKPAGERPVSTAEVVKLWRQNTPFISGTDMLRFASDARGPGSGAGLSLELSHVSTEVIEEAAQALALELESIPGVNDVDAGSRTGKIQLSFHPTEEARSLGLTASSIAQQLRAAYFGAEVLRQQRGRNEVIVKARLPENERQYKTDIENFILFTPEGGEVPLYQVTNIDQGRAYSQITRRDGRRTLLVTANVEPYDEVNQVIYTVQNSILPKLVNKYPGLSYSFEGRQADMRDAINSFFYSVIVALLVIYALLAIPFRSYLHPLTVMMSIPFGIVGAILGHLLMGYSLSIISIMGMIALGGMVINAAIVMIDYANQKRASGIETDEAIWQAGVRRFRPILLTTLTTFLGLAPMIFETSRQAQFLIPMAISLGYGIIFATAIIVFLTPCLYLIIEDIRNKFIKA
jgi:multidrug efflux pump subunit AcrB